jgi:hypothetical protein
MSGNKMQKTDRKELIRRGGIKVEKKNTKGRKKKFQLSITFNYLKIVD